MMKSLKLKLSFHMAHIHKVLQSNKVVFINLEQTIVFIVVWKPRCIIDAAVERS